MSRGMFARLRQSLVFSSSDDDHDDGAGGGDFYSELECRRRRRERQQNAPPDLPAERLKRLSIDQGDHSAASPFHSQVPDCPLFQVLPAEIRDLIWRFAIPCDAMVHIARLRGRMAGLVCQQGDPDERVHGCWGEYDRTFPGIYSQRYLDEIPGREGERSGMDPTMALLRTCRRM
jgi:hypothetical protein